MANAAVPIETLAREDVEKAVSEALRGRLRPGVLDDFLATVAWTKQERTPKAIREMLGMLEHYATEYAESDLSEADYREQLLGILPAAERLQVAARE